MLAYGAGGHRLRAIVALLATALALSACQFGGGEDLDEVTPADAQATPAATGATSVAGQAVFATPPAADSTAAAGSTNVVVSPPELTLGNLVLTFAVQPAQPMYDPARVSPGGDATSDPAKAGPKGYAVLASALKLTNNFDVSQSAPVDQPRELVRHIALQIKDKQSGQLMPHVGVTIDLLRDGRPVLQDLALPPMVPAGGNVAQLQYGNNLKIPGPGEYQVFVHLEASPLLGDRSPGVAQFNVSVR